MLWTDQKAAAAMVFLPGVCPVYTITTVLVEMEFSILSRVFCAVCSTMPPAVMPSPLTNAAKDYK